MLALAIIGSLVTYAGIGIYAGGRWAAQARVHPSSDQGFNWASASLFFWPFILVFKIAHWLHFAGYTKKLNQIKAEEEQAALQVQLDAETTQALRELNQG